MAVESPVAARPLLPESSGACVPVSPEGEGLLLQCKAAAVQLAVYPVDTPKMRD